MTIKQQKLYNIIESLPEELSNKVIEFIEYLKYTNVVNNGSKDLTIKEKNDLRKKLEEGIKDTNNGKVCSVDEAFSEIETILAQ